MSKWLWGVVGAGLAFVGAGLCLLCLLLRTLGSVSLMPGLVAFSHIEGNVPSAEDFDEFMTRDLETYFRDLTGKDVTVEYELLRQGPTQSGVAYPKFYLWVKIYAENDLIDEGAVRVAAINKERFDITDYLTDDTIGANPEVIYTVFPATVCEEIEERIE